MGKTRMGEDYTYSLESTSSLYQTPMEGRGYRSARASRKKKSVLPYLCVTG